MLWVKANRATYNSKRLGSKRAFANALVILSPSPPVILSKAKNLIALRTGSAKNLESLPPSSSFKVGVTKNIIGTKAATIRSLKLTNQPSPNLSKDPRPVFDFEVIALTKALKVSTAWLLEEANKQNIPQ